MTADLSPVSAVAARTATRSADRYAQDVADAVHANVTWLLATRGEEPSARAWAAVQRLAGVATSAVARNAAAEGDALRRTP